MTSAISLYERRRGSWSWVIVTAITSSAWVDAGNDAMVSTSVFDHQAGAEASNEMAADWVRENPGMLPNPPRITAGVVLATKFA